MSDTELPEGAEAPPPRTRGMAIVRWLLVAAAAGAAIFAFAVTLGTDQAAHQHAVWTCPMHPQIASDRPGECPICHMTLVLRREAPAAAPSEVPGLITVELSPERRQSIGVTTTKIVPETASRTVRAVATLAPAEGAVVEVQARFPGWIEELAPLTTGAVVERGTQLALLYSPDLALAQAEYLTARRVAPGLVEEARRKLSLLGIADDDVAALERLGRPLRTLRVRAPASGVLTRRPAARGAYVTPGTALFEITALDRIWAVARLYERDLAAGAGTLDLEATVRLPAFPGEPFTGRVVAVAPALDAARSLEARVLLANPAGRLRPGMSGELTLTLPPASVLLVPRGAVADSGDATYVFARQGADHFVPRKVELGAVFGDRVAVVRGLAPGDEIVTSGSFLVDAESRLQAALRAAP